MNRVDWIVRVEEFEVLKTVLQNFPEPVFCLASDGRINWTNGIAGFEFDNPEGKLIVEVLEKEKDRELIIDLDTAFRSKRYAQNILLLNHDGEDRLAERWLVPVLNGQGDMSDVFLIYRKLPALYTEKIQRSWVPISDSQKVKHSAAPVSHNFLHDLKNPLNGLNGFIQLVEETDFPEAHGDLFEMVTIAYEKLLSYTEQLETQLIPQEEQNLYLPEVFSLRKLLASSIEPFRNRALKRELYLKHQILRAAPDLIQTDRYRLAQFLSLWIEVMVDDLYRGFIDITASLETLGGENGVRFEYQGTGVHQHPLFRAGYVDINGLSLSKDKYDLQLSLQRILSVKNLKITLQDEGFQIDFFVPVQVITSPVKGVEHADHKTLEDARRKGRSKPMILIAEDDFLSRMTLQLLLNKTYELVFAKTGMECIQFYMQNRPDLVILDIMLPDINGFEVYERIEAYDASHPAIIACTARVLDTESDYLKSFGFKDYLPKPIQGRDIKKMLTHYI